MAEEAIDQQAPTEERIPLVNAYGQLEHVPSSKLAEAKAQGYRPETDEEYEKRYNEKEYGGTSNELKSAGLGVARSLTFGLSDQALTHMGVASPLLLARMKETNPGASLGGEVAGAVLPLLFGDAGGLVGGAAEGAGAAVEGVSALGEAAGEQVSHLLAGMGKEGLAGLGREVASKMAGGAVQGAFYGAGHEISEAALGDTELTAERLLMGAGTGALLGGAVDGVIGLTGGGLSMIKKAVEEKLGGTLGEGVQKLADDFAETSRVRAAFGQSKKAMKKVYDEETPYFGEQVHKELKTLFEERGAAPTTIEDVAKALEQRRDEVGGELQQTLSGLDEVTAEHEASRLAEHGASSAAVEERNASKLADWEAEKQASLSPEIVPKPKLEELPVAAPTRRISMDDAIQDIRKRAMAGVEPASHRNAARVLDDYLGSLKEQYGETVDFAQAAQIRAGVQELGNFDQAVPKQLTEMWRNASRAWNDYIDEKAAPLLKEAGLDEVAYKSLRQRESGLIKMTNLSKDQVLRNIANRRVSITDNMAGMSLGGGLLAGGHFIAGPVGAMVGAAANKLGRMYGPAGIAHLAEKTAQMLAVARASAKIDMSLSEEAVAFIEKATLAGKKVAEGAERGGAHVAEKAAHERLGEKIERISVPLAYQVFANTRFLPKGHEKSAEVDVKAKDKTLAAFRARADELTALVSNPDAVIERASEMTRSMTRHMPETATFAAQKIMQAAQFLYDKMPKPPDAANPIIKNAWQPARAELERFARYVRAADDPKSVLQDLRAGRVSKEGVEVLRELYPKVYSSVAGKMVSKLSEQPAYLDHQSKIQLSRFLGAPIEGALRPDRTRILQQQWAGQPQQGQGGGGMRVTGIDKLQTDQSVMTRSQQLAQGHQ